MREIRRRSGNLNCAESSLFYRSTACRLRYLVKSGYRGVSLHFGPTLPVGRHGPRSCQYAVPAARPPGRPAPQPPSGSAPSEGEAQAAGGPFVTIVTKIMHTRREHDDSIDVTTHRVYGRNDACRDFAGVQSNVSMASVDNPLRNE